MPLDLMNRERQRLGIELGVVEEGELAEPGE
jgi:hypothetical protein